MLLLTCADGTKDNSHLFGFIIIMRKLLNKNDFNQMKHEIMSIQKRYTFVNMKYYGFCTNWEKVL